MLYVSSRKRKGASHEPRSNVTIRTRDLPATRSFFLTVFGLEEGERPLAIRGIPGHWLYSEGDPLIHLIGSQGYGPPRRGDRSRRLAIGRLRRLSPEARSTRHSLFDDGPGRSSGAPAVLPRARRPVAGSRFLRTRSAKQLSPARSPGHVTEVENASSSVDSHTCRLRHRHRRFVIAGILPRWRARSVTEGQAGNLITAYALTIVVAGPIPTVARPF